MMPMFVIETNLEASYYRTQKGSTTFQLAGCTAKEHVESIDIDIVTTVKDESLDNHDNRSLGLQPTLNALQTRKGKGRWWTVSPLICPLSKFPICLLPYPPFRFSVSPKDGGTQNWVDGKFLSLQVIASGDTRVCGCELRASDVRALDAYMHRCKLGSIRLGRLLDLEQKVISVNCSAEEKEYSASKLKDLRLAACLELKKLQQIKKHRLSKIRRGMSGAPTDSNDCGDAESHATNHAVSIAQFTDQAQTTLSHSHQGCSRTVSARRW
jgi:hypothetical protein